MTGDLVFQWLPACLLVSGSAVLMFASFQDIAVRTLPNWCALFVAGAGTLLRLIDGTILPALTAAVVVSFAAAFCWRRGWLGGGDVKMLAACVLLVTPGEVLPLLLMTSLAGGVLAIAYLGIGWIARRRSRAGGEPRPVSLLRRVIRVERWRILRGCPLPYGCAIAFAAISILFGPLTPWR